MRLTRLALTVALILAASPGALSRTPVILITDIGTDIDDTWALAMALHCPELEVKLVLVDPANTTYRAAVAAKFLEAAGRGDIPVALGDNQKVNGDELQTLTPWIQGYDLGKYPGPVYKDGVSALIDTIESSREPVTLIAIGPVHSLALALKRSPGIAAKCRLVGMYGSFDVGYGGGPPSAETNVRVDPAALRAVLAAPWIDILLTPLDTCGSVGLDGERYHAIWTSGDPTLRAIDDSYRIFAPRQNWMKCDFFETRSTTLFDCVAVYLSYAETFVQTEAVTFDVTDDGYTRRSARGPYRARVAIRWADRDGFEAQLVARLLAR